MVLRRVVPCPRSALVRFLHAILIPALALSGCAFDPPVIPKPPPPPPPPINDTPQNAMLRFEAVYEQLALAQYEALFASDFRFTFSSQSDPELVATWGTSWGKDDEIEATSHLFTGFVDSEGNTQPRVQSIELEFEGEQFVDDPAEPDSGAWYKYVIVPRVRLDLVMADGREFTIDAPHDFHLVRGDAAVLDAAQERRADRWYVLRWDDRSPSLSPAPAPSAKTPSTAVAPGTSWGGLRAEYASAP